MLRSATEAFECGSERLHYFETFEPTTSVARSSNADDCNPPLTTDLRVLSVSRTTTTSERLSQKQLSVVPPSVNLSRGLSLGETNTREGTYRLQLTCREPKHLHVTESARTSHPAFLAGKPPYITA